MEYVADEVVSFSSVSSFKRHLDWFWCDWDLDIIITKPLCWTGSHSVIVILVKFLW